MTWRGHLTISTGELTHASHPDDVLTFAVHGAKGQPLQLTGTSGNAHWRGEVSADRQTFAITCRFKFRILGTVEWRDGRYDLVGKLLVPPELRLPGEAA